MGKAWELEGLRVPWGPGVITRLARSDRGQHHHLLLRVAGAAGTVGLPAVAQGFKLMSIKLLMPFNHLSLCRPLLLLPSIFHSIRVFSSESILCIRWPKYWIKENKLLRKVTLGGLNFFQKIKDGLIFQG